MILVELFQLSTQMAVARRIPALTEAAHRRSAPDRAQRSTAGRFHTQPLDKQTIAGSRQERLLVSREPSTFIPRAERSKPFTIFWLRTYSTEIRLQSVVALQEDSAQQNM